MKFVVLACAVVLAVGQTLDTDEPQRTHIKHNGAEASSTDAGDAVSRTWATPSDNADPISSSPGASRGDSTLATTNAPSFKNEVHTESVNSQGEANMEERTAFKNRKREHVGNFTGYDASGRLNPLAWDNNVTYNPAEAKEACETACGSDEACKFGCSSWLAYSSLNWEPVLSGWRDKLLKRCKKNCLQPRKWRFLHEDKAKHAADHTQNSLSQSYWYGRAAQMIPTYKAADATNFEKVPYDKFSTSGALPFSTAHECTQDAHCDGLGTCGADVAEAENLPATTKRSCINLAEQKCQIGCDNFKTAQDSQL